MLSRLFKSSSPADTPVEPEIPRTPSGLTPPGPTSPGPTTPIVAPGSDGSNQALVDALVESRRRFKKIVEVSGDFAWETDSDGTFVFVSPGLTLGYRPDELIGTSASRFLIEGTGDAGDTPFHTEEPVCDVDIWLRTRDGREICLSTSAIPVRSDKGEPTRARGVCRDITEERRQNAAFAALQQREASMARIVRAVSVEMDPNAMIASALFETRNTMVSDYADIRRPDEEGVFHILCSTEEGTETDAPVLGTVFHRMTESKSLVTAADADHFYLCAPAVFRGTVTGALLLSRKLKDNAFSDDERRFCDELATQFAILLAQFDSHQKLESMARTDEMTALLNRRAFMDELSDRTIRASDGGSDGVLFYVDLDNFKAVNDVHGHTRGDEALIALADLLVTQTRPGDLVARLGGDEFAMWLDRTDTAAARKRAAGLIAASNGLRVFSGTPDKPLGISVGVAVFDAGGDAEAVAALMARADAAMYEIKHGGKSGYVIAAAAELAEMSDETTAADEATEPDWQVTA